MTSLLKLSFITRSFGAIHALKGVNFEIKTGMVFALETYCPASDGYSAARIEEEVIVTDIGCQVISLFPAEKLPIANRY